MFNNVERKSFFPTLDTLHGCFREFMEFSFDLQNKYMDALAVKVDPSSFCWRERNNKKGSIDFPPVAVTG